MFEPIVGCWRERMIANDAPPTRRTAIEAATRQSIHVDRACGCGAETTAGNDVRAITVRVIAATSTDSMPDVNATRASRNSVSSTRQSAHRSTCASTSARALASSRSCRRSGSRSRTSALGQSVIEKLLHGADGIVIVNPRRTLSRADQFGNLLVRQPLCNPQREHLPLRRRKILHRLTNTVGRLTGDHCVQSVVFRRRVTFLNVHSARPSFFRSSSIEQQTSFDREQPRSKRAVSAKSIERVKGANERVLDQIVDFFAGAEAGREARERLRMPRHELRRGPLIAALLSRDEVQTRLAITTSQRLTHSVLWYTM